jgi:hypothetical protein
VVQPSATRGEPSDGAAYHGGDRLPQLPDRGDVAEARLLALDPELARVGRVGADHVADQLIPVPAATARPLAQLGGGGGGDLVEGRPGRIEQADQAAGRRGVSFARSASAVTCGNGRRHSGAANAVAGPPGTRSTTSKATVAGKLAPACAATGAYRPA